MYVIGITGTNGSGKWTVVEYLVAAKWFVHLSVRQFLEDRLQVDGQPCDRPHMHVLANELRRDHGADYIARMLYEQAVALGKNAVIESIRATGEIATLRAKGNFLMLGVDAPKQMRYERIIERGNSTDHISFDQFVEQENKEMSNTDPTMQNITWCLALCDHTIINDGTIEELHHKVDEILGNL